MKITNIDELRKKMLKMIDDLEDGKIDIREALAINKMADTVVNASRSEMQYAAMTNSVPCIPFYEDARGITLENKENKKLL